jgi:hypothetical protein
VPQVPTKGSAVPATLEIAHLAHAMPALSPENGLMVRNLFRDGLGALLAGMRHHTVRLLCAAQPRLRMELLDRASGGRVRARNRHARA